MTEDFATVLRRARRTAGLTQEELADTSGLSVEGISALERGQRRRPHAQTVDLLVAGLSLDETTAQILRSAARPSAKGRAPEENEPTTRAQIPTVPRQLLAPPASYVGRDALVQDAVEALSNPLGRNTPKVLAVTGMGGIGKSALALLAAHQVAEHYPDGQIYLDLRGQGDGEPLPKLDALAYILTSLGVRDADIGLDPDLAAAQLRTLTNGSRLLLVLDNAANPAQVEPLLPAAPGSAAIITSRQAVAGLLDVEQIPLTLLDDDDAERLLAGLVGADRLAEDHHASRTLVRACAGVPLALRLVGARLQSRPSWPASFLADRLDGGPEQLDELSTGDVDIGGTLLGSIDQLATSADAGDHDAAAAMHIVGVLPSVVVSPVAIAAACGWERARAERAIERLVAVSLVEEPVPDHYRVHDLLHAIAAQRATEESGADAVREVRVRVLTTYRAIAWRSRNLTRAVPPGLDDAALIESNDPTVDPVECVDLIARDIDLVVALAKDIGRFGGEEARLTSHTVLGLISYYVSRADSAGWRSLLELAVEQVPEDAVDERICLHLDLALFHSVRGHTEQTMSHTEEVIRLAEATDRAAAVSSAHSARAIAWRLLGKLDEAVRSCGAALEWSQKAGDQRSLAAAYRDLGLVKFRNGEKQAGLEAEQESLRIYRSVDVPRGVAMALVNVGVMLRDLGEMEQARAHLQEAVEVAHGVTDRALEAEALDELGYWHVLAGDPDRGLEVLSDGLALVDVRGGGHGEASIRHRLGMALEGLGRSEEADTHWRIAIRLHEQRGEQDAAADLRRTLSTRQNAG